jgi:ribosomal protein S27AE
MSSTSKNIYDVDALRAKLTVLQGVCKDCGNGTLNNDLNPAFELFNFEDEHGEAWHCMRCSSTHLDLL